MVGFDEFFEKATGNAPFPFQREFAMARSLPQLIDVPTGLGKTAMVAVGWLWGRFGGDDVRKADMPKRLVYCLPMRVLVEQTAENIRQWGKTLCGADIIDKEVPVYILMGGEQEEDWDLQPEMEAVLVGTQDMLISRALNRGYASSRSRWPMRFGLLHTDCLWVFDEIQLMGAGLATTAQLEAFRHKLPDDGNENAASGHGCRSVWMSATMRRDWLRTVDFQSRVDDLFTLELTEDDRVHQRVRKRIEAKKPLEKASSAMGGAAEIAKEVLMAHKPGTRTIVVVNTVKRACEMFDELDKTLCDKPKKGKKERHRYLMESKVAPKPGAVLLHSRFRHGDRADHVDAALAQIDPENPGTIVVSTQVIEAGVDVSSTTLFTELAPWASLVQRFGRCNRRGEDEGARVFWFGLPDEKKKDAEKLAPPYDLGDLDASREFLADLRDVGILSLPEVDLHFDHVHVLRRKDLIDLFDTTPDLAGNDIDIDRFVREVEDSAVRVFWRDWDRPKGYDPPPEDMPAQRREELCPAPIGEFRDFVKDARRRGKIWRWNFLNREWDRVDYSYNMAPGQVFLVHADAGGYSAERGWDLTCRNRVEPINPPDGTKDVAPDATDKDQMSHMNVWQTIAEHNGKVSKELACILDALAISGPEVEALRIAALWHDRGKVHEVFQKALPDGAPASAKDWAKADGKWSRYSRSHFRHELASALAVLLLSDGMIPSSLRDLAAYLVAAHHGKVRLSIRSLPNEKHPHDDDGKSLPDHRFARGVWDGDELPETDLGAGVTAPAVKLSLEPMELGLCQEPPFAGQPSWAERMLRLRDTMGPFRLAYLEAILRAADWRASRKEDVGE